MFQGHKQRAVLILTAVDSIVAAAAFEFAYRTRTALPMSEFFLDSTARTVVLVAALVAVVGAGRGTGIYSRLVGASQPRALVDTLRQTAAAAPALLAFLYLLNFDVPVSRLFLALFFAYLAALQVMQRALVGRFQGVLRRVIGTETSVVLVGDSEKALDMARKLESSGQLGIRLLAIIDCGTAMGREARLGRTLPIRQLNHLSGLLTDEAVDEVVFVVSGERLQQLRSAFALCDNHGVKTRVRADFFPHVHSRVDFDRFGDWPLLTFSIAPADEFRLMLKRGFDAAFAALGLVGLCLPMLIVALLVKATSNGPVLFKQRRCGLNGRLFDCYKFRSMVEDAEAKRAAVEHLNEKDGPAFKIRDDPRLTPVGRFLRRFSVDEWPQFWNVLRGEMSFVGPRPATPSEVEQYETWQRRRLRMRPGLTCLWAVRGRDRLEFDDWMQMDLEYIDSWSLSLDLKILARSVPAVLAGRGAY